jgi:hypothetical protein
MSHANVRMCAARGQLPALKIDNRLKFNKQEILDLADDARLANVAPRALYMARMIERALEANKHKAYQTKVDALLE